MGLHSLHSLHSLHYTSIIRLENPLTTVTHSIPLTAPELVLTMPKVLTILLTLLREPRAFFRVASTALPVIRAAFTASSTDKSSPTLPWTQLLPSIRKGTWPLT